MKKIVNIKEHFLVNIKGLKKYIVGALVGVVLSGGDTLYASVNHPFHTSHGIMMADELSTHHTLKSSNGEAIEIKSIVYKDTIAEVYDIDVDGDLGYYVGHESVLVAKGDLCAELIARPVLTDGLNALPPGKKGQLMKDLGSITDATHRQALMDVLNSKPKGIEAWDLVKRAILNSSGKTTEYALDPNTVSKIADYLSGVSPNPDKITSIGGTDGLENFIKNNRDVPCATCTSGNPVFAGRRMDEMIENYVEVGYAYRDHPTLWAKLKTGAEHPFEAMREGTQHTLEIIKNNPNKYAPDNIQAMDLRFEDIPNNIDNCTNCRYDIKFKPTNETVFAEFKSYALTTWEGIKDSPKFIQQFKNYLSSASVNSINDFQYIFNTRKASIGDVKAAFKELLINKSEELYQTNPLLFNQFEKIGGGLIEDLEDFEELVNHQTFDIDHIIFNFIKEG